MSTAIQKVEQPGTIKLTTERAASMRLVLQEEKEVRALVREFIAEQMVIAVDYGPMPGVFVKQGEQAKNVLFKPGAEKLFDIFRCKPVYRVLDKTVDPVTGLYFYEIRCRAVQRETGTVLNEGLGSASSYESRYRYRNADRVCPLCKKAAIIKGAAQYGGGWLCFKKKGGCNAKWPDGAKEIEGQEAGKIQNPDLADVANTVLKIAKKRAQVDCAIGLARVSDLFTADLEDLPTIVDATEHAAPAKPAPPADPPREVVRPRDLAEDDATRRAAANIANAAEVLQGTVDLPAEPSPPAIHPTGAIHRGLLWKRLTKSRTPKMANDFLVKVCGRAASYSDRSEEELRLIVAELDREGIVP